MSQQPSICDGRRCGKEVDDDICRTCRDEELEKAFEDGKEQGYEEAKKEFEPKVEPSHA